MSAEVPEEVARMFYRPFCSEPEIDSILSVSSVEDYLLKLRADAVADHMRIYRVMRRRMTNGGDEWSFTESFHHPVFADYVALLKSRQNAFLESGGELPPSGFIYATEPNGICMKTEFGNLITISESLKYALYYMNLCHLDFGVLVPDDVRHSAEKIAVRIMLETESLDFDLDPRGIVPKRLHRKLLKFTEKQIRFVLAHEYAHHIGGHLEAAAIIERPMLRVNDSGKPAMYKTFSYRQQQEFDADLGAITQPRFSGQQLQDHVHAALTFLAFSDVFRSVSTQIPPHSHGNRRTLSHWSDSGAYMKWLNLTSPCQSRKSRRCWMVWQFIKMPSQKTLGLTLRATRLLVPFISGHGEVQN